jgi:hypothetical protein
MIPGHETEKRRDESSRGGPAHRREATSVAARLRRGPLMGEWASWALRRGVEYKGEWVSRELWRVVEDKDDEREMGAGTRR